jgi:uncharacterized protein (DUF433 family)
VGLSEKPAEGVSAKVLRSASQVHARVTVNGGADKTPSAGLRESLAFGVSRPREGHGQWRREGDMPGVWKNLPKIVYDWSRRLTMTDLELLTRITVNPKVLVGKPVIRGTRLSVEYILNLLAHGATMDEIIKEYQGLKVEDIRACILFATKSLENTVFIPPLAVFAVVTENTVRFAKMT